ncbi:MAG: TolB family protein [Dehalococcoidia bacterium]
MWQEERAKSGKPPLAVESLISRIAPPSRAAVWAVMAICLTVVAGGANAEPAAHPPAAGAAAAVPERDGPAVLRAESQTRGRKWIAYDTTLGIHLIRPDGSESRMLVAQVGARRPAWSPDGRWVAFEQRTDLKYHRLTPGTTVQIVRADGTGRRRLVRGHTPAWSADGREIYYHTWNGRSVMAINPRSGVTRALRFAGPTRRSLDGTRTAMFSGGPCGPGQPPGFENICDSVFWLHITTVADGTTELVRVPRRSADPLPVSWSATGEILYNCVAGPASRWRDMCGYQPATGRFTHFKGPAIAAEMAASASPDGSMIAFAALEGLYVRRRDGGRARWLVRNPAVIQNPDGGRSHSPFGPAWQP